ncbi:NAD(P)H-binding protein, partial [Streptomyces sparsus]
MILVTGASGTVGGAVAASLTARGHPVRRMSRTGRTPGHPVAGPPVAGPSAGRPGPGRAGDVPDETATGDFDDPESLRRAMDGVRAALVVTSDPLSPWQDGNVVSAAQRAGVERLVKLSLLSVADDGAHDLVTEWQRTAEAGIRDSGLAWTVLRPRAFMTNTLAWARQLRAGRAVRAWPADAPTTPVDPRDIAEVAALALTAPRHAGRTYALTGPAALSSREQLAVLADVLGRPLTLHEWTPAQA